MMFNKYTEEKQTLSIKTETPYFCEKYYNDDNKKCKPFYQKMIRDEIPEGVFRCPYGFSCYKCNGKIYSCLIITDHSDLKKVNIHLKTYKQQLKDFSNYSLSQIRAIINQIEVYEKKEKILRLTIHDLKNATKHFMDLADSVKQDESLSRKIEQDDELFSAIEGYSLIQYRLDYHDQLLNSGISQHVEKRHINFHKMIMKLSKLMKYRGNKKDVDIEFHGYTNNRFWCNRDMYLASFIFIENAIKYAEQYSTINISFKDEGRENTYIEIENTCGYISANEMENIYNDGFRGEQAQVNSKGSGLGLGLAKKICNRSGVELRTEFCKMGSTKGKFVVHLSVQRKFVENI